MKSTFSPDQPIGKYEVSTRGDRFINVDGSLCKLMGYRKKELLSINPLDLLDRESLEVFTSIVMRKELNDEVTGKEVFKVKTKEGKYIKFLARIVNFKHRGTERESVVVEAFII